MSNENPPVETMSDEEFFAARRETMGDAYPGDDAMRQFDREADTEFKDWQDHQKTDTPAADTAQLAATEWNAGNWLRETFKDDPNFSKLSADEFARLEAMANEKHEAMSGDVNAWATEFGEEWSGRIRESVVEGLEASPTLETFAETHLADGDFSEADRSALEQLAKDIAPSEAADVIRPIAETLHDVNDGIIDGAEMIVGHAIDDVHDIVEARAEMTGGDSPEVTTMLDDLEAAPAQVGEFLDWDREQSDYEWGKVEDRLDAISDGADPRSLHDRDTWQQDPNEDAHESAEA